MTTTTQRKVQVITAAESRVSRFASALGVCVCWTEQQPQTLMANMYLSPLYLLALHGFSVTSSKHLYILPESDTIHAK